MAIVYLLTNVENGKCYVGKTIKSLDKRWYNHTREARRGSKFAIHAAIRKYGPTSFNREVLSEHATEEEALLAEKAWIDKLRTIGEGGYNMCEGGRGTVGLIHKEETKAQMSAAALAEGRRPSEEAIRRSAEVRALGLSEKAKANLAKGQRRRREEQPVTDEFRERMREVALSRPSPGSPSEKVLAKRSIALRAAWARRKAAGHTVSEEEHAHLKFIANLSWEIRRATGTATRAKPVCRDCGVGQTPVNSSKCARRSTGLSRRCRECDGKYMATWKANREANKISS